jgi:hypothetical protein
MGGDFMELILGGKTFVAPVPKARMIREAIRITEETKFDDINGTTMDKLVNYVVDIYGKQFTIDEVYDALDADKLIPTLMDCISDIVGQMGATLEKFPNGQPGVEEKN